MWSFFCFNVFLRYLLYTYAYSNGHGNDSDLQVPYPIFLRLSLTFCRIAGLEWVFLEAKASGRPSVVNISRGHEIDSKNKSQSVQDAIGSVSFFYSSRPVYSLRYRLQTRESMLWSVWYSSCVNYYAL
jgi:hypothetical protein